MSPPNDTFAPFSDDRSDAATLQLGDITVPALLGRSSGESQDFNEPELSFELESIALTVRREDDLFVAELPELNTFGTGKTEKDAVNDALASLQCTWEGLKDHADHELTEDAIELRNRLAQIFDRACDLSNA
jgi:hypothetical protein